MLSRHCGWHGCLLHVDLNRQSIRTCAIEPQLLHSYLGGRGLGVRLLRDAHHREPCSAGMPLIFAVGPLGGTAAPTSARMSVVSRSPLTGTVFDSSCGGSFAWHLKAAGFDALLVTGCSPQPVLLDIKEGTASLVPASRLWGQTVSATHKALAGAGSCAAIGPAGERLVRYANIITSEGNAAGRGGLGAVMGAKGLKAIRVDGRRQTRVAEQSRLAQGVRDVMRLLKASPFVFGDLGISRFGTPALVDVLAQRRLLPAENFRKTLSAPAIRINAAALHQRYQPHKRGCHGCPVACKQFTEAGDKLPEFGSLGHFAALGDNPDLDGIVAAARRCNDLGLDTQSAAASLACWSEIKGDFPRVEQLPELLEMIAYRRGVGELLAQGAQRLADELHQPQAAMTVKGLELPPLDPRGGSGLALSYVTSNRGACHLRAFALSHEVLRKPVATDPLTFAGKARINTGAENTCAAVDSLVACRFALVGAGLEEYAALLTAVTGLDYTAGDLQAIGERIFLTERFYNQNNGFDHRDDVLPPRFFTSGMAAAEGADMAPVDGEAFADELRRYYRFRGLDEQGRLPATYLDGQP